VIYRPAGSIRFAVLVALAAGIALASLVSGSTEIGVRAAFSAMLGDLAEPARTVVLELRVPRLLSAFAIGALLALAGVLLQALFRNPLADSYVLGVSGGSAVGALAALLVGGSLLIVQSAAAAGAMLTTLLVLALARGGGTVRVLLTGMEAPPSYGPTYTSQFRQLFRDLAKEQDVAFMPFFLEGVAGIPRLNQADGIHPTAEGAVIVEQAVWKSLKPLFDGVGLKPNTATR